MKSRLATVIALIFVNFLAIPQLGAQNKSEVGRQARITKVNTQAAVLMNANNITSWVQSNGNFPALVKNDWNGEFPKGFGVGTVYQEGIVFGGKVFDGVYSDSIRVTGNTYFVGMQPGSILVDQSGNVVGAEDPSNLSTRAYAVRADMPPSIESDTAQWPDMKMDAATYYQKDTSTVTSDDIGQYAAQYFIDWKEWPAAKGAPWFIDSVKSVRNDPAFDPNNPHDIPGIPDAAETIWYVSNDLSAPVTRQFAGAPPIGMEEQVTLWAFHNLSPLLEPLENVIFKQVKLIYKGNIDANSSSHIDSLFICQWVDGDVGDGRDDYGGCDTLMNFAFEYNSTTHDAVYSAAGLQTPSDGFMYVNGSANYTGNPDDSAVVNFQWRKGYRYNYQRPMTTLFMHQTGGSISDPDNAVYSGSLQWFNVMRSCLPRPQYPGGVPVYTAYDFAYYFSLPTLVTKFTLSGDPVTRTGWIDGVDHFPGDRRFWSIHGPISLRLNDTAEVDIAHIAALGADNLASLQVLKYYASFAKYAFNASVTPSERVATSVAGQQITPRSFEVGQNYPNPFNPSTTIQYQIPAAGRVTIKVFNLLGQEVAALVDEMKQAGSYDITWNASNMPSGVYFCRTQVTSSSNKGAIYRDVKKMVLIK